MHLDSRGFVLQPTYRIERGRAVVLLYGKLESGESFLVRDGRETPHFYVEAMQAERARELGATRQQPSARRTLGSDRPVVRVEVPTPGDTPALRDRLTAAGIPTFEADVRFAMRYLIDRGIQGSLRVRGEAKHTPGLGWVLEDPEVEPADWVPRLEVLSLDIETDLEAGRVLSIALATRAGTEVLMGLPRGATAPVGVRGFAREKELLAAFFARVRALDPDVLTGWNLVDFDLSVIARRAQAHGLRCELGRGPGELRLQPQRGLRGGAVATVPGRQVLDGIELVRGAFLRYESYALDFVAREVLGEGKLITGHDRGEEIQRLFREDRARLAEYNAKDARLVLDILDRLQLVELAVARSRLTGMPLDRVAASIASFDFLYLAELGKVGVVAPSVDGASDANLATSGGHVLEPRPGLYDHVLVFDFKSLYPSVMRTFGIDPLGFVPSPGPEDDLVVAPNGAAFRRGSSILPRLLDELFPRREAAKAAGDTVASGAIKILMNSFYGVLATPACRFANQRVANAITTFGRDILLWSKARLEQLGYNVLYGDTDSLFVASGAADAAAARQLGRELAARLTADLARHVAARWRVESRFELAFDRHFLKLHLQSVRHGSAGARKRYAGLVDDGGSGRVTFTGMESVRRDATELAKQVQRGLYERLFRGEPVESFLRQTVEDLRAGRLDAWLVYKKALRKPVEAYTATTPPHVAAARKIPGGRRGLIAYWMTTEGAEPVGERRAALDYQHYVDKQVRPIAEPVFDLLGIDLAKVLGDQSQLRLF